MTREQYERKAADGTLTVGDVLRNSQYATPEQIDAVTGYVGVHLNDRKRTHDGAALSPALSELVEAYPSVVDAARYVVDCFAAREQADHDAAAEAWDTLNRAPTEGEQGDR